MFKNSFGQALIETLFSLPLVLSAMMLVLVFLYSWTSHFLIDHWVYQSALCLSQDHSIRTCRKELEEKLNQIPFLTFQVRRMTKNSNLVHLLVETHQPLTLQTDFEEKLRLPLAIEDFKVYQ